jgi:hypothetical protein
MQARRDTPKSGSRREAISVLVEAARYCEAMGMRNGALHVNYVYDGPSHNNVQAALNYMIMHDGW